MLANKANAVARIDNLEFLSDVIPPTVPYKQVQEKKKKAAKDAEKGQLLLPGGQKILPIGGTNGSRKGAGGKNGNGVETVTPEIDVIVDKEDEGNGEEETPSRGGSGLERFVFGGGKS